MDGWYFDVGTGPQGPYLIDELLKLWREGKLGWDARVLREGDPEWRPVRGHGAFIDAIFAREVRTGGAQSANRDAEPRERRATPTQPVADTQRSPRPIMDEERVTETARAPHDSLAPFDRPSRPNARAWPAAIVLASSMIAGGVLVWAVRSQHSAPASTASAETVTPAPSVATASSVASVPNAASAETAVPADEPAPKEDLGGGAQVGEERVSASASVGASTSTSTSTSVGASKIVSANKAAGLRPAGTAVGGDEAGEEETSDGEPEELAAAAEPTVPVQPAPPAQPRESDFLNAAAPLPDVPTTREIASAMRAIAPAARECARGLPAQTVYVTVAITGKSGRASRVEVPELDGSVQSCVVNAVRSATFPRFERPELELRFPFLLGQ